MNASYRALLWEECRVGGSIALGCLVAGLLALCSLWAGMGGDNPLLKDTRNEVLYVVFGLPLALSLLLTLRTANSGNLSIAFPPRLLRLPVYTRPLVALLLGARLGMMLTVAGILALAARALFVYPWPMAWVPAVCLIFLYVQTLAHLRKPAPVLAALGCLLLGGCFWALLTAGPATMKDVAAWVDFPALALASVAVLAPGYAVNVWAVGGARRGHRVGKGFARFWPERIPVPRIAAPKAFSSAFAAQVWWELRHHAIWLPLATFVNWCVMHVFWSCASLTPKDYWSDEARYFWDVRVLSYVFAIVSGGLACAGLRLGVPAAGRVNTATFAGLRPVTSAELALAKLAAYALVLASTLLVVTGLSLYGYLASGNWTNYRDIQDMLANGCLTHRELAVYLSGMYVVAGLFLWALVGIRTRTALFGLLMLAFGFALLLLQRVTHSLDGQIEESGVYFIVAFVVGTILWLLIRAVRSLSAAHHYNLVPRRHLALLLGLWAVLTFFFLPAPEGGLAVAAVQAALAAALGAACILPYPALTLAIEARRHHGARKVQASCPRGAAGTLWGFAALVAMLLAGIWLRWPETPGYVQFLHAHGWPATCADLKALDLPVQPGETQAKRYTALAERLSERQEEYLEARLGYTPTRSNLQWRQDTLRQILFTDRPNWKYDDPIPENLLKETQAYYEAVGRDIAAEAKAVAKSGLPEGRYPLLGASAGAAAGQATLAEILDNWRVPDESSVIKRGRLSGILFLEVLLAVTGSRPEDVAEPLFAQLSMIRVEEQAPVRFNSVYYAIPDEIQHILNSVSLPGAALAQLKHALSAEVLAAGDSVERCVKGDTLRELAFLERYFAPEPGWEAIFLPLLREWEHLAAHVALVRDVVAWNRVNGVASIESIPPQLASHVLPEQSQGLAFAHYWASIGPYWRVRLEQAAAACAVEEYRLAHGQPPESLQALVPEFLAEVPKDYFGGQRPLAYRVLPDGSYNLYSLGHDQEDDGGVETVFKPRRRPAGDLPFWVKAPRDRRPPEVVDTPAP